VTGSSPEHGAAGAGPRDPRFWFEAAVGLVRPGKVGLVGHCGSQVLMAA
jgi:hypothetical protein